MPSTANSYATNSAPSTMDIDATINSTIIEEQSQCSSIISSVHVDTQQNARVSTRRTSSITFTSDKLDEDSEDEDGEGDKIDDNCNGNKIVLDCLPDSLQPKEEVVGLNLKPADVFSNNSHSTKEQFESNRQKVREIRRNSADGTGTGGRDLSRFFSRRARMYGNIPQKPIEHAEFGRDIDNLERIQI